MAIKIKTTDGTTIHKTNILTDEGIKIARRTVAKYREELNYSVARLRKELK